MSHSAKKNPPNKLLVIMNFFTCRGWPAAHLQNSASTLKPSKLFNLSSVWRVNSTLADSYHRNKQQYALPPLTLGPTEHFYLSSPPTAFPSQFSARWRLIPCISGCTYGGKRAIEVVVRGSMIQAQNPQRASSTPYEMRALFLKILFERVHRVYKMQTSTWACASKCVAFSAPRFCIYFLGVLITLK